MAEEEGKIDLSSPYYLGSGDQPGNLITHVILQNDNYLVWSRAMTLARRKFVFIDGAITKPTTKSTSLNWDAINSKLVSWILRSVDSKLTSTLPYFDDTNGPRLQQIRVEITTCRQTKTMSVDDYYNKLIGLLMNTHDSSLFTTVLVARDGYVEKSKPYRHRNLADVKNGGKKEVGKRRREAKHYPR
ncbi:hypothetical protein LIER_17647 [Lithospermum erythrorhizon]|uniref:Retrotransposon Copia-like N-terminal domain-containing protein n=1 Tax=Lithospermum erythrorhizon TaxID=34254 RepID=A0AAV3QB49_LITER